MDYYQSGNTDSLDTLAKVSEIHPKIVKWHLNNYQADRPIRIALIHHQPANEEALASVNNHQVFRPREDPALVIENQPANEEALAVVINHQIFQPREDPAAVNQVPHEMEALTIVNKQINEEDEEIRPPSDQQQVHPVVHLPTRQQMPNQFICNTCNKKLKTKTTLKRHFVVHSKLKNYKCNVNGCNKSYTQKGSLSRHKAKWHK